MFHMPFEDSTFDIVFNADFLEHYSSREIIVALKEMGRISKERVVIAIPNHYSVVYRSAYLFRIILDRLKIKRWMFSPENKYYDLKKEIEEAGLILEERITMSQDSIWMWWPGCKFALIRYFFDVRTNLSQLEDILLY